MFVPLPYRGIFYLLLRFLFSFLTLFERHWRWHRFVFAIYVVAYNVILFDAPFYHCSPSCLLFTIRIRG